MLSVCVVATKKTTSTIYKMATTYKPGNSIVCFDDLEVTLTLDSVLHVGKYRGRKTVYEVIEEDLGWMKWALGEKLFTLDKDAMLYYKSELRDAPAKKLRDIEETTEALKAAAKDLMWNRRGDDK